MYQQFWFYHLNTPVRYYKYVDCPLVTSPWCTKLRVRKKPRNFKIWVRRAWERRVSTGSCLALGLQSSAKNFEKATMLIALCLISDRRVWQKQGLLVFINKLNLLIGWKYSDFIKAVFIHMYFYTIIIRGSTFSHTYALSVFCKREPTDMTLTSKWGDLRWSN